MKFGLLICLILSLIVKDGKRCKSEYFTALAGMETLIETQKNIPRFLDLYVRAEKLRLKNITNLINVLNLKNFSNLSDEDSITDNPINLFHLINWFSVNGKKLITLMNSTSFPAIKKHNTITIDVPNEEELTGIADAMNRLITLYDLKVQDIAKGKVYHKIPSTKGLSADDCFLIGAKLYNKSNFKGAIPWLEEAKHQINLEENSSDELTMYAYLSQSYFMIGDILKTKEILQEYLNVDSAKKMFKIIEENYKIYIANGLQINQEKKFDTRVWKKYQNLCNKERLMNTEVESRLRCYYLTNNSPYLTIQLIKVEDIFHNPWIKIFHDIISDEEIKIIKTLALPKLKRAMVVNDDGIIINSTYRISKSSWLEDKDHTVIDRISRRFQEITGLEVLSGADCLQVVNYGVGGNYDIHLDYTLEGEALPEKNKLLGNRIATLLIYLSDVKVGGATVFPLLNLGVHPEKGSAVLWFNLFKSGVGNFETLHAGCPVLLGTKWVANKWIHTYKQEFRRPCGILYTDIYEKSPYQK